MAPVKLTYFDLKGIAEPIRFILSYAGEEFIDERVTFEEWPEVKPKMPYGKMPVLEIDGKAVTQSRAIARYYAKKAGLAGENDWEALLVDSTVDTIDDFRFGITRYYWDPADEITKLKKHDTLVNETIPFHMERLDKQAKENGGYFVNGKLTWADIFFVALLDYMNPLVNMDLVEKYPTLQALRDKVLALPAIKAWVAKRPESQF